MKYIALFLMLPFAYLARAGGFFFEGMCDGFGSGRYIYTKTITGEK